MAAAMALFFGPLVSSAVLLVAVTLTNLPVIGVVMLMRRRFGGTICAAVLAASFAGVGAYLIWTAEWFDVYRHGMPSVGYFLRTMVAGSALMASFGWMLGRAIASCSAEQLSTTPQSRSRRS